MILYGILNLQSDLDQKTGGVNMEKTVVNSVQRKKSLPVKGKPSIFVRLMKHKRDIVMKHAKMLLADNVQDEPAVYEVLNSGKLGKLIRYMRKGSLLVVVWGGYLAQKTFS